jgi:hypothetical protein
MDTAAATAGAAWSFPLPFGCMHPLMDRRLANRPYVQIFGFTMDRTISEVCFIGFIFALVVELISGAAHKRPAKRHQSSRIAADATPFGIMATARRRGAVSMRGSFSSARHQNPAVEAERDKASLVPLLSAMQIAWCRATARISPRLQSQFHEKCPGCGPASGTALHQDTSRCRRPCCARDKLKARYIGCTMTLTWFPITCAIALRH